MSSNVESYLAELRNYLSTRLWTEEIKAVSDEVASHLSDQIDEHTSSGMTNDEAVRRTLESFGSSKDVAAAITKDYPPFRPKHTRELTIIGLVLLVFMAGLACVPLFIYPGLKGIQAIAEMPFGMQLVAPLFTQSLVICQFPKAKLFSGQRISGTAGMIWSLGAIGVIGYSMLFDHGYMLFGRPLVLALMIPFNLVAIAMYFKAWRYLKKRDAPPWLIRKFCRLPGDPPESKPQTGT